MKALSIAAALATAVQAVALIMLHLLPTDYNPVRDAVSDYGIGPYRGWFWLQTATGGVGCLALGIALAQLHPFTPTQVVVALIVTAGARFLIPFFATDQDGSRFQTLHGTIHMILAVLAFGGLVWVATFVDWEHVSADLPDWQTSWRHLTADGKAAELTHPSAANQTRDFPTPVQPPPSVS